ncbi:hypothetical protein QBC39DRAFT_310447 [Podospora conica]|nr:hypothetical protein QBC39DRAFT_310447 [Schizothecium conicum]
MEPRRPHPHPHLEPCSHPFLHVDVSPSTIKTPGFKHYFRRPTYAERLDAATPTGGPSKIRYDAATARAEATLAQTFPAPLVLPGDWLFEHPETYHEGCHQPLSLWRERRPRWCTSVRDLQAVYVVPPPSIPDELAFLKSWSAPSGENYVDSSSAANMTKDIFDYLGAHFHPVPVHLLPPRLRFTTEPGGGTDDSEPALSLRIAGPKGPDWDPISTRPAPDGVFPQQLDVDCFLSRDQFDDLSRPGERIMVVMVVEQDLFDAEDPETSPLCSHWKVLDGRSLTELPAVVVSAARYHPSLFREKGLSGEIDMRHVWPSSHCRNSIESKCRWRVARGRDEGCALGAEDTAMGAAMRAAVGVHETGEDAWFGRVVRRLTRQLGNLSEMGDCAYYACVMQHSLSIAEEVTQPPYLCPVCLTKWTEVITEYGHGGSASDSELVLERYERLRMVTEGWKDRNAPMLVGYHAWLEKRVEHLREEGGGGMPVS